MGEIRVNDIDKLVGNIFGKSDESDESDESEE